MWPISSATKIGARGADGDRLQQREAEHDFRHEDRQHEHRRQPGGKLDAVAVERIGGRNADQQRQAGRQEGEFQAGDDGAAEGADLEDVLEPAQRQALRREGQVGGVAERRAEHDDQRPDQEDVDQHGEQDEQGVDAACHHQVAIGLRRRAMRLIASTTAMVIDHHDGGDGRGADPVEGHHGALIHQRAHHHLALAAEQLRRRVGGEAAGEDEHRADDQARHGKRQHDLPEGRGRRRAERGGGLDHILGDVLQHADQRQDHQRHEQIDHRRDHRALGVEHRERLVGDADADKEIVEDAVLAEHDEPGERRAPRRRSAAETPLR